MRFYYKKWRYYINTFCIMKTIDPSDNFGGGKVKFFSGGGGAGEIVYLAPITFGSNNILVDVGTEGMIPLNGSFFNLANSANAIASRDAISNLPYMNNNYFYFRSFVSVQRTLPIACGFTLELYIDGVVVQTEVVNLETDNFYDVVFSAPTSYTTNPTPVSSFGIYVTQITGEATNGVVVNSNHTFFSIIDGGNSEWFGASNFLDGLGDGGGLTGQMYNLGLGGSGFQIPFVTAQQKMFNQSPDNTIIDIYGFFFSFTSANIDVVEESVTLILADIGGNILASEFIPAGNYPPYIINKIPFPTRVTWGGGIPYTIFVDISLSANKTPFYEIGLYGVNYDD